MIINTQMNVLDDFSFSVSYFIYQKKEGFIPFHTLTPYTYGGRSRTDSVFLPSSKL